MKRLMRITFAAVCLIAVTNSAWPSQGNEDGNAKREKTFTVKKGGELRVSVNAGEIRIKTWEKNEVHVRVVGESDDEGMQDLRLKQSENTISVEYDPEWGSSSDVEFDISIPSQFNISLETSAGDIGIEGKLSGTVNAHTSGGNIQTGALAGPVDLNTSGGDIVTGDVDGDLTLHTSGGNIQTGKVTGTSEVKTSGGDIIIESSGKSMIAKTAGGNVQVGDINGDATVVTSGGDIILDKVSGNAKLKTAGGNIRIDGANGKVTASKAGGDITMDNIVGSIEAKTASGNLDVDLSPGSTGQSTFSTSMGDA